MGLPKAYEPGEYEADIYGLWERGRVFIADPHSPKEHFSIAMPPPNETSTLHIGSALFVTLQDILARHARQQGKDVLWLPGTDHAAIATDNLVEKQLAEQGTSKHEIGREEFIKRVKQFVGGNRERILAQLRAMGASCDWTRLRYTLDDALNRCVNEVFAMMYEDGLIYRGSRIVNWDPNLETTVSDDEVDHREEQAPFYTLKYGPFEIGTARPETKFGDKYVVMHPDDKRYAQYKQGDTFEADWINGRVTATVIKDEAVDPQFGTGVMTITPWHDHTDFEIAERHGLEKEQIIGFDGRLLPIAGEFAGLKIDEARPRIVEKLKSKGLLIKEDGYSHNVAVNSRGGGLIEPQIMLQWFVDVNRPAVQWKGQLRSLREVMRAAVEDGDIKIVPKRFEKIYFHWIDNLHDWCISRQIWWGHRIPVWYKGDEIKVGAAAPEGQGWQQDPDTLDTWFSSALWTWSTLVDQELAKDYSISLEDLLRRSLDFQTYHPTSVMETGWDILFFWVARMILATTYTMSATGQPQDKRIPFETVYLHGLVRTEAGKKMSKSDPETVIDPMEIIPKYGTDALRLALVSGVTAGNDQRLGTSKIVDNRNFCNKLWNIARYVESTGGAESMQAAPKTPADHWILNKLSILTEAINADLDNFRFGEAYQNLYHFAWDDLADWYVEASKAEPNPALLRAVLESTLITAHPFAPFITEAIWQNLEMKKDQLLAAQPLAQAPQADSRQAKIFEEIMEIVSFVRAVKSIARIKGVRVFIKNTDLTDRGLVELIGKLAKVKAGQSPNDDSLSPGLKFSSANFDCWLDVDEAELKAAVAKLQTRADAHSQSIKRLEGRLANKDYLEQAPAELIEETGQALQAEKVALAALTAEISAFLESIG